MTTRAASAAKSPNISNGYTARRFRSCKAWASTSTWCAPSGITAIFSQMPSGGAIRGEDLRVPHRRQMFHQPGLQDRAHTKIPRRNCRRPPSCPNEYRAVYRHCCRRTAPTGPAHRQQKIALGQIRLHRADGETTLRRSRVAVADLLNRNAWRMLVLSKLSAATAYQPAAQSSRTMDGIGRVKPHPEFGELRI